MFNLIFGIIFVILGLCSVYAMVAKKEEKMLKKLPAFRKFWGEKLGTGIYIISYMVMPIVCGIMLIYGYTVGINVF